MENHVFSVPLIFRVTSLFLWWAFVLPRLSLFFHSLLLSHGKNRFNSVKKTLLLLLRSSHSPATLPQKHRNLPSIPSKQISLSKNKIPINPLLTLLFLQNPPPFSLQLLTFMIEATTMASHFSITTKLNLQTLLFPSHKKSFHFVFTNLHYSDQVIKGTENKETTRRRNRRRFAIRVSNGDSYLDMWKQAVDRDRKETEFQKIVDSSVGVNDENAQEEEEVNPEALEKKTDLFKKILEVPKEERDRIQRMQVIDRASAALAAAQAILKESPIVKKAALNSDSNGLDSSKLETNGEIGDQQEGTQSGSIFVTSSGNGTPGPDFWSWTPPVDDNTTTGNLQKAEKTNSSSNPVYPVIEKERTIDSLSIPFQSTLSEKHNPPLPPLQSLTQVGNVDLSSSTLEAPTVEEQREHDISFSVSAAEAAEALNEVGEASPLSEGQYVDGSKWWKETGIDVRPDGVVCKWTLTRGISADQSVEWEEKFWEAAGASDYKELGSEKSGRDATGNVWREYWKESMWQDLNSGLVHMEKSADKWGKNGIGGEWHEKWWEHYDASGQAEKSAHKWCSIDPNTPLDAGHAHVWHERWGETYDGQGASTKYTDKWAERSEGDGWAKWGDKWDENFNQYGQGVKQGETWWQGKYGDRWNRTWGEGHNGSGWIHKYGKSSCGEHWDTHVQQDTWYERYPHFGFDHCFENSPQLREVGKPPETA